MSVTRALLSLFLGTATASGQEVPNGWSARPPEHVEALRRQGADLPLSERIEHLSAAFLGADYRLDPIGEWRLPDPDPPARYDSFDCLIYVEEVLALAMAADALQVPQTRHALRYLGEDHSYQGRKHFMELQWIPDNIATGWLVDVTASLGPTVSLSREINPDDWARWTGRSSIKLTDEQLPTGTMQLEVLPIAKALTSFERIEPGSVVFSVHQDRVDKPIWISHVGFAVENASGGLSLRHASTKRGGKVHDLSFSAHLANLANAYEHWPMLGIVVLQPQEQGPRRALLTSGQVKERPQP